MQKSSLTGTAKDRYGVKSFLAALVTSLAVEIPAWAAAMYYVLPLFIYVLPALAVIDLAVYSLLAKRPGTAGQIGRGILIGSLSVPLSAVVFTVGFIVAHAIGPI
ncbi:hypothetical protein [Mycobacterium heckeshornense]|uniref:Uncharacterized protein n=1 Tax=Mycobacterium heckeshornense TaxID=110505 RepID=A0A7R7YQW8_9MYCO|nr:hypothetical protein [Mycobacterium heckeshornense]BCO33847.1 hypothetical protein MHEC_02800 [Mycobacterium heckeshornense]BCQ06898.1 hypothetical protein JMUB5695_00312 [Mycobacterium heckeshornense]